MRRVLLALALSSLGAGCELEHPAPPLEVQAKNYFNARCTERYSGDFDAAWEFSLETLLSLDSHAARVAVLSPGEKTVRVSGAVSFESVMEDWLGTESQDILVPSGSSQAWSFSFGRLPAQSCPNELFDSSVEVGVVLFDKSLGTQQRLTFGPTRPAVFRGGRCEYPGRTTHPCGRCLARNCETPIDTCCSGNDVLGELYACAASGDCAALKAAAPGHLGAVADLQVCLETCATDCELGIPAAGRACQPTDDGCRCQASAQPNQLECSAQSLGGVCCRDDEIEDCQCRFFGCTRMYGGCDCFLGRGAGELPECVPAQGERCCENGLRCGCGTRDCLSVEREVASCTPSQVSCAQGVLVSSCSL